MSTNLSAFERMVWEYLLKLNLWSIFNNIILWVKFQQTVCVWISHLSFLQFCWFWISNGWMKERLLVSSSSPLREKIWKGTTYQLLILSTTDICKLSIKRNLFVSVTLTLLRLQSQATYQLSIISMGPAPDWHFSPTHPCTFLFTFFFLQIWTLLIWQTAKYCLTINLAMGENFLRDLGGETVNGSQCSSVCVPEWWISLINCVQNHSQIHHPISECLLVFWTDLHGQLTRTMILFSLQMVVTWWSQW